MSGTQHVAARRRSAARSRSAQAARSCRTGTADTHALPAPSILQCPLQGFPRPARVYTAACVSLSRAGFEKNLIF